MEINGWMDHSLVKEKMELRLGVSAQVTLSVICQMVPVESKSGTWKKASYEPAASSPASLK